MACMGRTSRSRRPCARGEVLCTEPGKSHPCPDRQAGPVHEGISRTMNMHADENSDGVIVPEKRPNKEGSPSAEAVEGRTPPKGNGGETAAARTLRRDTASNGLIAVRRAARQSKSVRFTALLHHITIDLLKRSYLSLERDSAPGIDGVTWQTYGENLEEKLEDLHDEVHRGSYRARPARRTYIPKADGSKRPLSILCLEDKIVQQAVATVLEDSMGVDSGQVWSQTEVAQTHSLETTDVARSFFRWTDRYPQPVWRNFRFVGTEPFEMGCDVAVARQRREDVAI